MPSQSDFKPKKTDQKVKSNVNAYLKYSGMAFEMAVIMFIAVWVGKKMDVFLQTSKPWFTLIFAIVGTFGAFYFTLKDLLFPKKNDD